MFLRYLGKINSTWLKERALADGGRLQAESEAQRLQVILSRLCSCAGVAEPELLAIDDDGIICGAIPLLKRDPVLIFAPTATTLIADDQLEAFLAHELGHIEQMRNDPVNAILSNVASSLCWLVRKTPPLWAEEYQADAFAANLVGSAQMQRALRKVADCVDHEIASYSHPPLSSRLERLLQLDRVEQQTEAA